MQRNEKIKIVFLWIFRALLLFAIGVSIYEQNWMSLALSFLTLFLTFLPSILEKRLRVDYPEEFEMGILFFIFASLFLGEAHSFYEIFWWWDIFLHGLSAIILGQIAFSLVYILNKEGKVKLKPGFIALFAFCFALAGGAVWEIVEFSIDYFVGTNMQKSGLMDTMFDIIIDALGALIVSVIGYFYAKGRLRFLKFIEDDFMKANPHIFRKMRIF